VIFAHRRQDAAMSDGEGVHQLGFFEKALLWILSLFARLYYLSLRYRAHEGELAALADCSVPSVLVIWHNRILLSPKMRWKYRPTRRIYAAISSSRDGSLISAFIGMLGIRSRRGSSSRRASAVALELMQCLKQGHDIAITPDGPRGPLYSFHEGAAALARMANAPVILLQANPRHALRFNSWDGFYLPAPFSVVEMRGRRFTRAELPKDRAECAEFLRKAMLEMTSDLPEPPRCARERRAAEKAASEAAGVVIPGETASR
jgi:lysophospholipid acyltransferase (LPLAT)-like uncharacterized protein